MRRLTPAISLLLCFQLVMAGVLPVAHATQKDTGSWSLNVGLYRGQIDEGLGILKYFDQNAKKCTKHYNVSKCPNAIQDTPKKAFVEKARSRLKSMRADLGNLEAKAKIADESISKERAAALYKCADPAHALAAFQQEKKAAADTLAAAFAKFEQQLTADINVIYDNSPELKAEFNRMVDACANEQTGGNALFAAIGKATMAPKSTREALNALWTKNKEFPACPDKARSSLDRLVGKNLKDERSILIGLRNSAKSYTKNLARNSAELASSAKTNKKFSCESLVKETPKKEEVAKKPEPAQELGEAEKEMLRTEAENQKSEVAARDAPKDEAKVDDTDEGIPAATAEKKKVLGRGITVADDDEAADQPADQSDDEQATEVAADKKKSLTRGITVPDEKPKAEKDDTEVVGHFDDSPAETARAQKLADSKKLDVDSNKVESVKDTVVAKDDLNPAGLPPPGTETVEVKGPVVKKVVTPVPVVPVGEDDGQVVNSGVDDQTAPPPAKTSLTRGQVMTGVAVLGVGAGAAYFIFRDKGGSSDSGAGAGRMPASKNGASKKTTTKNQTATATGTGVGIGTITDSGTNTVTDTGTETASATSSGTDTNTATETETDGGTVTLTQSSTDTATVTTFKSSSKK